MQRNREGASPIFARRCGSGAPSRILVERNERIANHQLACLYHLEQRNRFAPLNISQRKRQSS